MVVEEIEEDKLYNEVNSVYMTIVWRKLYSMQY